MFFSPELLAKRDSGFGLLWLAATLGSKSTFKKLPKRSVLTADLSKLCDLIAQPAEPLALRLSSNLMVVKQEIFMSDVSTCVASLKKVVQEMQSAVATGAQLQMAQPTVRASALTLAVDPKAAYPIDFDALVADWDEYLNIGDKSTLEEAEDDDEFKPKAKEKKTNRKVKAPRPAEDARADMHTLKEHHDHLLSNSFDLSFHGNGVGMEPSSSQAGGAFALDDMFLAASDILDLSGGLGDDLAMELGEGWGIAPGIAKPDFDFGAGAAPPDSGPVEMPTRDGTLTDFFSENLPPSSFPKSTPRSALSPATSFSRLLLSQDLDEPQPLLDVTTNDQNQVNRGIKKVKKTRLLLDARTELTDEELKQKKSEKDAGKILENMMWGVPRGVQAESLVEFWQENFKVQHSRFHLADEPPNKRRKIRDIPNVEDAVQEFGFGNEMHLGPLEDNDFDMGMYDENLDGGVGGDYNDGYKGQASAQRSSEEPGQGRHVSRAPSVLGSNFDIAPLQPVSGSQKSSLFPWDNAGGASSSVGGFGPLGGSDQISVDRAEVKMRGSSLSRRESSLVPSQAGSVGGLDLSSPFRKNSQGFGEDYAFDVENAANTLDSQRSDMNLITLERNSFNFLEYIRMQLQSLPDSTTDLDFDAVVPTNTSTRHVAAAAFYHCLVLATKDLLHLKQRRTIRGTFHFH
ncbi:hypothetical protein C8J57DRAFT_1269366 [Mycena rebaudengoi]|nr:hypothetical protein C8J57DRAFT_1269366 [Mycena rebaudengoi]